MRPCVNWLGHHRPRRRDLARTNLRLISGDISARFDGQTTSTPDAIPVSGEIVARAQSGVFTFDRFTLNTGASTPTATGRLALDGDSGPAVLDNFDVRRRVMTILNSPGLASAEIERLIGLYEPHLFGDFNFTGTLTGKLDNPTIAGDLQASRAWAARRDSGRSSRTRPAISDGVSFRAGIANHRHGRIGEIQLRRPTRRRGRDGEARHHLRAHRHRLAAWRPGTSDSKNS